MHYIFDCNSGCPFTSEELSIEMSTTIEVLMMESSTGSPCKDTHISTYFVTALPTSLEDVGYVETAEDTILENLVT